MEKNLFQKIKQNHFFAMILCCAIPLILLGMLSFGESLGSWGYYVLFLLCPLLHVFMMKSHSSHSNHGKDQQGIQEETLEGEELLTKTISEKN